MANTMKEKVDEARVISSIKLLARVSPHDLEGALEKVAQSFSGTGKTKASPVIKGYLSSVKKHVKALLVAIRKMQLQGENVSSNVWAEVEQELAQVSLDFYKKNAEHTSYIPRISKGGRPPKNHLVAEVVKTTGKRGRPKGSTNKPKMEATEVALNTEVVETKKRRGRPVGSKNQAKAVVIMESPQKGRGRPKGSTNKVKTTVKVVAPKNGRGRPKGSKNKEKSVLVAA
jgi:hypothetical protein